MNEFTLQILLLVLLFVVMYVVLIRPQRKREKEVNAMRESLKVGDDVLTIGGIYGKVVRMRDDRITLQVGAERVRLEVAKWSISQKMTDEPRVKEKETRAEEAAAEPKRPTPKSIRKLGADKDDSEA